MTKIKKNKNAKMIFFSIVKCEENKKKENKMTSFKKYNKSPTGYETFIYYDEVVLDHTYYVQFVYSGYSNDENENNNNHEMTSETFQTNMFEIENENGNNKNKDAEIVSRQLYQNLVLFSSSSAVKVPLYIIDTLKFQLRDVIQRHS